MPKFCPTCGKTLQYENAEICPNCGVRVQGQSALINGEKSPGIAALLSFVFTGLGQVYNGDFKRGVLFLVGTLIGLCFFVIPGVIIWLYGIYDAYSMAKKMNAGEIPFKETNTMHMILFVVGLIIVVAIIVVLSAVVAAFVFGMAGNVQHTKIVAITASRPSPTQILVTNMGGPDVASLKSLNINGEVSGNLGIEIGSKTTIPTTAGKKNVIVVGTFTDGVQQILLDTRI